MTTLKAVQDGARFVSTIYEQNVNEKKWWKYTATFDAAGPTIDVQDSSSTLELRSLTPVMENDAVLIKEGTSSAVIAGSLGSVVNQGKKFVNSLVYDINTNVGTEDSLSHGVTFSSDGTKMFMAGSNNGVVFQYTLASAWDVSTASYDTVSFNVSGQDAAPTEIAFNKEGTKMFVLGDNTHFVYQYSLSTAWDLTAAVYDNKSIDVEDGSIDPGFVVRSLAFKSDGTGMFVLISGPNRIYQYTLGTAWDLSSASYDAISLSVNAQDATPTGITFSPNGTQLFMIGEQYSYVFQYDLSTPWDISTTVYGNVSFNVSGQQTAPKNITFKPNGTRMFLCGTAPTEVHQYNVFQEGSVFTDLLVADISLVNLNNAPTAVMFDAMPVLSTTLEPFSSDISDQGIPLDLVSATAQTVRYKINREPLAQGDKLRLMLNGVGMDTEVLSTSVIQTGTTVEDMVYNSNAVADVSAEDNQPWGMTLSDSGDRMYTVGVSTGLLHQYSLSTPWDLSTVSYDNVTFDPSIELEAHGVVFSVDGTRMFMVGTSSTFIHQYSLTLAWDLSTASYDAVSLDISGQESNARDLAITSDGTRIFVIGDGSDSVTQYDLATAWDLASGSYNGVSLDIGGQESSPFSMDFTENGEFMFITGNTNTVYQYKLGTGFDLSTAVYANKNIDVNELFFPTGVVIGDGDSRMFVLSLFDLNVSQYGTGGNPIQSSVYEAAFEEQSTVPTEAETGRNLHVANVATRSWLNDQQIQTVFEQVEKKGRALLYVLDGDTGAGVSRVKYDLLYEEGDTGTGSVS